MRTNYRKTMQSKFSAHKIATSCLLGRQLLTNPRPFSFLKVSKASNSRAATRLALLVELLRQFTRGCLPTTANLHDSDTSRTGKRPFIQMRRNERDKFSVKRFMSCRSSQSAGPPFNYPGGARLSATCTILYRMRSPAGT